MTLDKEEHRAILLELIDRAHFLGNAAETVVELKKTIAEAGCKKETPGHPRRS